MNDFRAITREEIEKDNKFFVDILFEIRDYAVSRGYEPDVMIEHIAERMLRLLKTATFNYVEEDTERKEDG